MLIKMMKPETKRTLIKSLACGLILTLLCGMFPFAASCAEITQDVMRLHVIANSDSPEDQAVKLKVRDAVLKESEKWYRGAETMEEANSLICTHLQSIREAAQRALEENGSPDTAKAVVTEMYFTTRDYGEFSLPAGKYRTLRVTIGEGKGKNWWCIVFPSLCLPASEGANGGSRDDLLAELPENEREIIGNPGQYQIKFKAVEWLEGLKSLFDR